MIVLELPVKGVGVLTSLIEPVEQYAKLEGMFPSRPIHVVAYGVDVLDDERRGGGVDRPELAIGTAATGPAHIHHAGGKTRHEFRTQTIILGQAVVKQGGGAAGAAEGKPRRIEDRGRESVILGQSNPLISRGR